MTTTNPEARRRIQAGRARLIQEQPFYGCLALSLKLEEASADNPTNTMKTDGKLLIYNPAWTNTLTPDELLFVLAHESMHCALFHHTRRNGRDPQRWNEAGDYLINAVLTNARIGTMPARGLYDPSRYPASSTTEEIYAALAAQPPDQQQQQSAAAAECGQVEDATDDQGQNTPSSREAAEADTRAQVAQAMQHARNHGTAAATLESAISAAHRARAPWRAILQRFVTANARNNYSWSRPRRQFIAQGLYLPGLSEPSISRIALAIDTSGSMDRQALDRFFPELRAILTAYDTALEVIFCNTRIQKTATYTRQTLPPRLSPRPRGGTDFAPVFDYIAERAARRPACLLYFSDLCGPAPAAQPAYPVLWIAPNAYHPDPPFGQVITL